MNPPKPFMGKLNNVVDIIPIASSSLRNISAHSKKNMKKSRPILSDPMLVPRVRQYLEDHLDQTYVDVAVMAQYLRNKYLEYSRRKEAPFRFMVESAYKTVLHSYGLDSNSSSDKGGSDDDLHMIEDVPVNNIVKNTINDLYAKQKDNSSRMPNTMSNNELIDISDSTEEEEEEPCRRSQPTNTNVVSVPLIDPIAKRMRYALPDLNISQVTKMANVKYSNCKDNQTNTAQSAAMRDNGYLADTSGNNRKRKQPEHSKMRKKKLKDRFISAPEVTFSDVGGIEHILMDLCDVLLHVKHPEIYRHLGTKLPRGFLLHGPPGCGKTLLAHAIAGKLGFPLLNVVATELVAGVSGESEERIREIFEQAAALAPCVLFFDEVDVISSNRSNAQKDMDRRIVSQLISSLDALDDKENGDQVLVIGATNRADNLDPSLRRVGRFDQEICLGIPDQKARSSILRVICDKLKLEHDFDFDTLAQLTPGYVGGDLLALINKAASYAVKRVISDLKNKATDSIVEILDETQEDNVESKSEEPNSNVTPAKADSDKPNTEPAMVDLDDEDKAQSTTDSNKGDATDKETAVSPPEETEEKTDEVEQPKTGDDKVVSKEGEKVDENIAKAPKQVTAKECDKSEVKKDAVDEIEQMSIASNNSGDSNKTLVPEPIVERSLKDLEAWIDDDEPPLNTTQLQNISITMEDFKKALKTVQPSAKREGFITVPNVSWDEVGSLRDIRQELQLAILAPIKYPQRLQILGLTAPSGVLLCGPPGCGKTLIAKAIANEAGINFISVKGPELLNMYVGESERAVRQCFTRARNSAPCVIFFDEFDSLCPKRSSSSTNGGVSSRVVNQLLTEMDGVEGRAGVFLMAATNRPDILDPAVLRPGRLDKVLYVGLPTAADRLDILNTITKKGTKPKMHSDVDLAVIANSPQCNGYTGADLAGLVRQASMQALRESMRDAPKPEDNAHLSIKQSHLLQALATLRPSVSVEDQKHYEKLRRKYAACNDGGGGENFIEPMDDS